MAVWPVTIPQRPLKAGYARAGKALLIRSPMESGTPKVRRRTTAGVMPISLSFRMSEAELAIFEAWVKASIGDGALSFSFPDPEKAGTLTLRMTGGAGQPLYDVAPSVPGKWVVSFGAEVMPT